jgi:predicted lipid-binding transport protein (Tim44 family)
MKHLMLIIAALLCLALTLDADAASRRLGGGVSSGMQRNNVMQRQSAAPAPASPSQTGAVSPVAPVPQPAPSGMSRWLGPLAGLAVGAGLASMFMGGGGGGGMSGLLLLMLLAAAAFFLYSFMRRRADPATLAPLQPVQYAADAAAIPQRAPFDPVIGAGVPQPNAATPIGENKINVPPGFDTTAFLRQAKLNFIRLQAANDRKDLHDIRNFTTPEMFAEISLQAGERGDAPQQTDVTELNAELLDVTEGSEEHLASVRFHGASREAPDATLEAFDEVWHLAKPADGSAGWMIAGIQQFG